MPVVIVLVTAAPSPVVIPVPAVPVIAVPVAASTTFFTFPLILRTIGEPDSSTSRPLMNGSLKAGRPRCGKAWQAYEQRRGRDERPRRRLQPGARVAHGKNSYGVVDILRPMASRAGLAFSLDARV